MKQPLILCAAICFLSHSTIAISQQCPHVAGTDWRVMQQVTMNISQSGTTVSGVADPDACASGWSISGSMSASSGEFTLTVTNPIPYPDFTYFCYPYVEVSGNVDEPGCDTASGIIDSPETEFTPPSVIPFDMEKTCDVPTGETSNPVGASSAPGSYTSAVFRVSFVGGSNPYTGRNHIQQTNPVYATFDTCYAPGSPNAWISLFSEGRIIPINQQPTYAYEDTVGRTESEVLLIRQSGIQLPCGNQFAVDYSLSCSSPAWAHYETGIMGSVVFADKVVAVRDSVGYEIPYP